MECEHRKLTKIYTSTINKRMEEEDIKNSIWCEDCEIEIINIALKC